MAEVAEVAKVSERGGEDWLGGPLRRICDMQEPHAAPAWQLVRAEFARYLARYEFNYSKIQDIY